MPCVITLFSTLGILNFHSQDDIWDIYAPRNALSRQEEKSLEKFEHMASLNHYRIQILIDRKDGDDLMNHADLLEISDLNSFVVNNISTTDSLFGKKWTYHQLCGVYCNESNALILGFIQVGFFLNFLPFYLRAFQPKFQI